MPVFKLLGIGIILGGVSFLLETIHGALRTGSGRIQEALGVPVTIIKAPMTPKVFPMLMMMGMMVLVIAIFEANISYGYWNHSIATKLNPAIEGSQLLGSLSSINTVNAWLAPFQFVGMAFLLTGIDLEFATIIRVLRCQSQRLWDLLT